MRIQYRVERKAIHICLVLKRVSRVEGKGMLVLFSILFPEWMGKNILHVVYTFPLEYTFPHKYTWP